MLNFWHDAQSAEERGSLDWRVEFVRTDRYPATRDALFAVLMESNFHGAAHIPAMKHRRDVHVLVFPPDTALDDVAQAAREVALEHRWAGFIVYQGNPAQRIRGFEHTSLW